MAKTRRHVPRTYTHEEKIALVTEIERRYRAGGGTLRAIAAAVGTTDTSYHNWVRMGIKPVVPPPPVTPPAPRRLYGPAERAQLLAEVDRRRGEGQSLEAACRTVGISDKSYRTWREDAAPLPAMRPVEVTALVPVAPVEREPLVPVLAPALATLVLVAPGGFRIEGLGVESAAALLRALA